MSPACPCPTTRESTPGNHSSHRNLRSRGPVSKPAPELQSSEIFYYQGGELGATNPIQLDPLPAARTKVPVRRDQAYWIRAGDLGGAPGDLFAGILQFTDSLHHTEVNAAVSARADSHAGLWVGTALVTNVNEYLKSYAIAMNQADFAL
jgi:hypothetical protein